MDLVETQHHCSVLWMRGDEKRKSKGAFNLQIVASISMKNCLESSGKDKIGAERSGV